MSFPDPVPSYSCQVCDAVNDIQISNTQSASADAIDMSDIEFIRACDIEGKLNDIMSSSDGDIQNRSLLGTWVGHAFCNVDLLNRSFLKKTSSHIDLKLVDKFYQVILKCGPGTIHSMMSGMDKVLKRIGRPLKTMQDCRFLLIYLENPVLLWRKTKKEAGFHHSLYARIFGWLVNAASPFSTFIVEHFYLNYSTERMRSLVECVNRFINYRCSRKQKSTIIYDDWVVVVGVKFMALIYSSNSFRPVLSTSEFYNTAIDYYVKLDQDYARWQTDQKVFSFCQYPFLVSMGGKLKILQTEAKKQMEQQMADNNAECDKKESPFLILKIRRDYLLEDSIQQISQCRGKQDLKKKLKVQFVQEEGVDAGGLAKEWLLLLTRGLFSPQYGMFVLEEETNMLWFRYGFENAYQDIDSNELYFLSGVVVGLAIYHSILLDVRFPLALYKKLLAQAITLNDLEQFKPSLARGLHQLLTYQEKDIEQTMMRSFVVTTEVFGVKKETELIPGGANVLVNQGNKHDFVKKYIDFIFNESIDVQFQRFHKGFSLVCAGNALSLFDPNELQMLVCGNPIIDVSSLQSITEYERIKPTDPLITWYWECLLEMNEEEKKRFMLFVTGSDHVPAVEGTQFRMKVLLIGSDSDRLPVAHTCFNQLGLYSYKSKEQLKTKLLTAIVESEGFGLR